MKEKFKKFCAWMPWMKIYPVLVVLIVLIIVGFPLWEKIVELTKDSKWRAGAYLDFVMFTLIVALVTKGWDFLQNRKYNDWELLTISYRRTPEEGVKIAEERQNIHWTEVKRFEESDFERWKFVKSVVSGDVHVTLSSIKAAEEEGWVSRKNKKMIINLLEIPDDHINLNHPASQGFLRNRKNM